MDGSLGEFDADARVGVDGGGVGQAVFGGVEIVDEGVGVCGGEAWRGVEVEIGIEGGRGVSAFGGTVEEVMIGRVEACGEDIGVDSGVPVGIEEAGVEDLLFVDREPGSTVEGSSQGGGESGGGRPWEEEVHAAFERSTVSAGGCIGGGAGAQFAALDGDGGSERGGVGAS